MTDAIPRTVSRYLELVEAFPLRPIWDDAQLAAATAVIRTLTDRPEDQLSRDEADYLDVLGDLVLAYEEAEHPILKATQAHILRALMEDRDVTQAQVAPGPGSRPPTCRRSWRAGGPSASRA